MGLQGGELNRQRRSQRLQWLLSEHRELRHLRDEAARSNIGENQEQQGSR